MSVDLEMVRASLTIPALLHVYGFEPTSAKEDRYNDCPACGHGRGKFKVTDDVCHCHACGFAGDVFTVAAALLDLSSADFPEVVRVCASIAGVEGDHDPAEVERTIEKRRQERQIKAAAQAKARARAESGAKATWERLSARSGKGCQYVASRGVNPTSSARECRYTWRSVCLPLWRDGKIVNVVGRRFDNGRPKIRGLAGCGTRGTFGRAGLTSSHEGPIVIVEGFFDYLSARELSPSRLVLGAHGCHNLPYVAEVAAGMVKGSSRGLVLVAHQDTAGQDAMAKARTAALDAGVSSAAITDFQVGEGCNDLSDHLCANGRSVA